MYVAEIVTYPATALIRHALHTLKPLPKEPAVQTAARSMSFPEFVRFRAERGVADALLEAARKRRTSASEYLRHALRTQLVADGVDLPPLDTAPNRDAA